MADATPAALVAWEDWRLCVMGRCLYLAAEGSSFCAMHDVIWGQPILSSEEVVRVSLIP